MPSGPGQKPRPLGTVTLRQERTDVSIPAARIQLHAIIERELGPWWEDTDEYRSNWDDLHRQLLREVQSLRKPYDQIVAPNRQPADGEFVLYWHMSYDDENDWGGTLYIGKSRVVHSRQQSHRKSSPWWNQIDYMDFEPFDDQRSLDEAEVTAIRRFRPRYNVTDNPRAGR
jgi:hypothetical protein